MLWSPTELVVRNDSLDSARRAPVPAQWPSESPPDVIPTQDLQLDLARREISIARLLDSGNLHDRANTVRRRLDAHLTELKVGSSQVRALHFRQRLPPVPPPQQGETFRREQE